MNNAPALSKPQSKPRGLLHETISLAKFDLTRFLPDSELNMIVENFWLIEWDRPGAPDYFQQNIPHPTQNLVIDPQGNSGVFGVQTNCFTYKINQKGALFGVKFWPGALRALSKLSMSTLTGTHVPIGTIFPVNQVALIEQFQGKTNKTDFAQTMTSLLKQQKPTLSEKSKQARDYVAAIDKNPAIKTVANLADRTNSSPRNLQRLFKDYIGVSPTWVVQRYRIIDAVDALNKGEEIDMTYLAQELGFYDSAHFSKAFKALVGASPSAYRAKTKPA